MAGFAGGLYNKKWETCSLLISWATGAEMLLVTRTGSGPAAAGRMVKLVTTPPWASTAAQLRTAPGEDDAALLGCPIGAAGDEVAWDTSSRCMDLPRLAWPRPRSRPSTVKPQLATRVWTGPGIENAHSRLPDIGRR